MSVLTFHLFSNVEKMNITFVCKCWEDEHGGTCGGGACKTNLVNGEGWGVDVGQPPDVVPRILTELVLQVRGEVAQNQSVHLPRKWDQGKHWNKGGVKQMLDAQRKSPLSVTILLRKLRADKCHGRFRLCMSNYKCFWESERKKYVLWIWNMNDLCTLTRTQTNESIS